MSAPDQIQYPITVTWPSDPDHIFVAVDEMALATYVEYWNCPEDTNPEWTVLVDAKGRKLKGVIRHLEVLSLEIDETNDKISSAGGISALDSVPRSNILIAKALVLTEKSYNRWPRRFLQYVWFAILDTAKKDTDDLVIGANQMFVKDWKSYFRTKSMALNWKICSRCEDIEFATQATIYYLDRRMPTLMNEVAVVKCYKGNLNPDYLKKYRQHLSNLQKIYG